MDKLLSGSVVWRMLCAVGAWLASLARGSRLNAAVARAWKGSALHGWLLRRLDAPDEGQIIMHYLLTLGGAPVSDLHVSLYLTKR